MNLIRTINGKDFGDSEDIVYLGNQEFGIINEEGYLFLGNIKAVVVPAVALPVSLIASFLGIYLFDLSINIFVLLSFILAIGIITDDSVIMTDAIYRRIENGENSLAAAYNGSKQITFAIIATTLILLAVFIPFSILL